MAFSATFTGTFNPPTDTSGTLRGDVAPDHLTLLTRSGHRVPILSTKISLYLGNSRCPFRLLPHRSDSGP